MMSLLRPELNRPGTFDEWLRDYFLNDDYFGPFTGLRSPGAGRFANLAADVYEDADEFHAVMELPGVSKEDVSVEVENAVVRVSGKHTDEVEGGESTFEFNRSLALPEGVDATQISAEMKDGLLHLKLPKREETRARQIAVS